MNERQYRQLLANEQRRFAGRARSLQAQVSNMLRAAAADARRLETLAEEWQRVARPARLDGVSLVAIEDGIAIFVAPDAALRYELSREAARLSRMLSRRVPGLRALRFVPFDADARGAGEPGA